MKLSDIGTDKQNKKSCELVSKTAVSCLTESKCNFEKSKLSNGDILLKSPKTRNKLVRELKNFATETFCGK